MNKTLYALVPLTECVINPDNKTVTTVKVDNLKMTNQATFEKVTIHGKEYMILTGWI